MEKTMEQFAQTALDCQDACNLSGVVFAFAEAMKAICEQDHAENHGTRWKNAHPVAVLFASKIASLTRCDDVFSKAYDECIKLAGRS